MNVLTAQAQAALAPVGEWLLADAHREADRILADARRDAESRLEAARREAQAAVEAAREAGEALAAESVARDVARARREARGIVLAAQESLRTRVRDAVHTAAAALRQEPDYPALLAHLEASARAVLGADSTVREAPGGGIVAQAGSRRVDLSLPVLADRALSEHAQEVARLWSTP